MSLKGRQLFVGNIPFTVGWQDLKDLFRQAGIVQRANIMQGQDGRSKGHGIVLFRTIEGADKATEQLNGFMWHGRKLEVREDRGVVDHVPRKPAVASSEDPDALADTLQQKLNVQDGEHENADGSSDSKLDGSANGGKDHGAISATPVLARTVHVGNIPFRVRWQDLKDLFRKAGRVVRADVALNHDNRSKGHGTVIFSTEDEAKNAISTFDQYQWQDRILQVQEERPGPRNRYTESGIPADADPSADRDPSSVSHTYPAGRQIFVGNLPFQIQWQDLKDLFQGIGAVVRADIALNYDGRSRGFGSVLFETHEDAKNAIANFNNHELNGRVLRVHYDRYTPMDGPLVHGAMGPMMHAPHHPHPHAHHQDLHSHRLHHIMHPQHGHGYQGNYHQPQLMALGNHPMVHSPNVHQFNLGLQPYDGNLYLPSMAAVHGSNAVSSSYLSSEEASRAIDSPLQTDLAGMSGIPGGSGNSVVTSQHQFNPDLSAAVVSPDSPRITSSSSIATSASPSATLTTKSESPSASSQYPFLANLGTIGQLSSPGLSGAVGEHTGSGLGSTSNEYGRTTSVSVAEEGDHGVAPLHPQHPYHSLSLGEGLPMRQDNMLEEVVNGGFTPQFYMYPPHQNQGVGQQLGHHHPSLGSYQQTPGYPTYQDQYSQSQRHHFSHGPVGVIGSHGNMSLGRGYMNHHQSEWMAHPSSFSMGGPPQHMYGTGSGADGSGPLAFGGHYGQETEGDEVEYNETKNGG